MCTVAWKKFLAAVQTECTPDGMHVMGRRISVSLLESDHRECTALKGMIQRSASSRPVEYGGERKTDRKLWKRVDPRAKARAEKSLKACLESIDAFQAISGITPISRATADDCAAFQRKALTYPKDWRHKHPKGKHQVD
jgi:hypothetical protein